MDALPMDADLPMDAGIMLRRESAGPVPCHGACVEGKLGAPSLAHSPCTDSEQAGPVGTGPYFELTSGAE
jgi:hypothetical protein